MAWSVLLQRPTPGRAAPLSAEAAGRPELDVPEPSMAAASLVSRHGQAGAPLRQQPRGSGLTGNALGANALIPQHCHNVGAHYLFDVMLPTTLEKKAAKSYAPISAPKLGTSVSRRPLSLNCYGRVPQHHLHWQACPVDAVVGATGAPRSQPHIFYILCPSLYNIEPNNHNLPISSIYTDNFFHIP